MDKNVPRNIETPLPSYATMLQVSARQIMKMQYDKSTPHPPSSCITLLAIILSGDIHMNPGPTTVYPCGCCERPVTWEHKRAICCDECSIWYHSECIEHSANNFELLQHSNVSWICCKCETQNIDSFTYHSYELELSNSFTILSNLSSIPSIDSSFSPKAFSSPRTRQLLSSTSTETTEHTSHTELMRKKSHNLLCFDD